jgi:hypothetical protein
MISCPGHAFALGTSCHPEVDVNEDSLSESGDSQGESLTKSPATFPAALRASATCLPHSSWAF